MQRGGAGRAKPKTPQSMHLGNRSNNSLRKQQRVEVQFANKHLMCRSPLNDKRNIILVETPNKSTSSNGPALCATSTKPDGAPQVPSGNPWPLVFPKGWAGARVGIGMLCSGRDFFTCKGTNKLFELLWLNRKLHDFHFVLFERY